jgi:hypothetical protein
MHTRSFLLGVATGIAGIIALMAAWMAYGIFVDIPRQRAEHRREAMERSRAIAPPKNGDCKNITQGARCPSRIWALTAGSWWFTFGGRTAFPA